MKSKYGLLEIGTSGYREGTSYFSTSSSNAHLKLVQDVDRNFAVRRHSFLYKEFRSVTLGFTEFLSMDAILLLKSIVTFYFVIEIFIVDKLKQMWFVRLEVESFFD